LQASCIVSVGGVRGRGKNTSGHYGQLSMTDAGMWEVQIWLLYSDQVCDFCIPAV